MFENFINIWINVKKKFFILIDLIKKINVERFNFKKIKVLISKKKKLIFRISIISIFVFITFIIVYIATALLLPPSINEKEIKKINVSSKIEYQDTNGNVKEEKYLSFNKSIKLEDLSDHTKYAFIALEDDGFYSHIGIDTKRLTGAIMNWFGKHIFFIDSKGYGGSTITMQTIKVLTNSNARTAERKFIEIWLALNIERHYTKDEILECYLNTISFGDNIIGIEKAANLYFEKSAKDLTPCESACLARKINSPNGLYSIENIDNLRKGAKSCLKQIKTKFPDVLSDEEYKKAVKLTADVELKKPNRGILTTYLEDATILEAAKVISSKKDYSENKVLDMLIRGEGGFTIVKSYQSYLVQEKLENIFSGDLNEYLMNRYNQNPINNSNINLAVIIQDYNSNEIIGMIGNKEKKNYGVLSKYNYAWQANIYPASTFKIPSIYAPAIENNLIDSPYDNISYGLNLMDSIAKSSNEEPVELYKELGKEKTKEYLEKADIYLEEESYDEERMVLGLYDRIPLVEVVEAYNAIANEGTYSNALMFKEIRDNKGKIIKFDKIKEKIYDKSTTDLITFCLKGVVEKEYGTAVGAKLFNDISVAGKTGTTDGQHDRLFVGYTPYKYLGAVWIGNTFDDGKKPTNLSHNYSVDIWNLIFNDILEEKSQIAFDIPDYQEYIKSSSYLGPAVTKESSPEESTEDTATPTISETTSSPEPTETPENGELTISPEQTSPTSEPEETTSFYTHRPTVEPTFGENENSVTE